MSTSSSESRGRQRILKGSVRSAKMDKTIVVEVTRKVLHRTYKKYVTRRVRYKAHDPRNECGPGDLVEIISCRPLSAEKRWRLLKLVEKAK